MATISSVTGNATPPSTAANNASNEIDTTIAQLAQTLDSAKELISQSTVVRIIHKYLFTKIDPVFDHTKPIDLSNENVLKEHLGLYDETTLKKAARVAHSIYETVYRDISDSRFGVAFPMDPEVLTWTMQIARDEVVIALGAAGGENEVLLAAAGAKAVYVNDITVGEQKRFSILRNTCHESIKKKLIPAPGDGLQILSKFPELRGKAGVVVCRNVIHLLNDVQMGQFFILLKDILKPDGYGVITVNSAYMTPPPVYKELGMARKTDFWSFNCFITGGGQVIGSDSIKSNRLFYVHTPTSGSKIGENVPDICVYKRDLGKPWHQQTLGKDALPTGFFEQVIQQQFNAKRQQLDKISCGSLVVVQGGRRMFTIATLSNLFQTNGFEFVKAFVANTKGHLVDAANPFNGGERVGIVVRHKP